jgi:hypothetical protein
MALTFCTDIFCQITLNLKFIIVLVTICMNLISWQTAITDIYKHPVIGNVMKNVCYLHHNGFLIFEQRLAIYSNYISTGYFMRDSDPDGIENATHNEFPKLTWIFVFCFKKHKT